MLKRDLKECISEIFKVINLKRNIHSVSMLQHTIYITILNENLIRKVSFSYFFFSLTDPSSWFNFFPTNSTVYGSGFSTNTNSDRYSPQGSSLKGHRSAPYTIPPKDGHAPSSPLGTSKQNLLIKLIN